MSDFFIVFFSGDELFAKI